MTSDLSRRDFMKTAGVAAAGVAIATKFSPFAYAQNEKVTVGCIGTGGQGSFHIQTGLMPAKNIHIAAVCDVYKPHQENGWAAAGGEAQGVKKYFDYHEMLEKETLDAVVITTPLYTHHKIAMDCLDAGKHIFLEKTMCFTIEECRDIVKKCHETGKICQVGHQRRYNPQYNKAMWIARDTDVIGRINYMQAQWHRNNDWRRPVPKDYVMSDIEKQYIKDLERHLNWRLYKDSSGGLMTELATHQLDITNWFLGAVPKRVSAYGGLDYWRDGRDVFDNIVLIYDYEVDQSTPGYTAIQRRTDYQKTAQINRPYNVRMVYSSTCSNARMGATECIMGDRASFELTEHVDQCFVFGEPAVKAEEDARKKKAAEQKAQAEGQSAEELADAITGGKSLGLSNEAYKKGQLIEVINDKPVDQLQMESFANDIMTGGTPKANQMVGLLTAVAGLTGMELLRKGGGEMVIDPAIYTFDFETPDPWRYEKWEEPAHVAQRKEELAQLAQMDETGLVNAIVEMQAKIKDNMPSLDALKAMEKGKLAELAASLKQQVWSL